MSFIRSFTLLGFLLAAQGARLHPQDESSDASDLSVYDDVGLPSGEHAVARVWEPQVTALLRNCLADQACARLLPTLVSALPQLPADAEVRFDKLLDALSADGSGGSDGNDSNAQRRGGGGGSGLWTPEIPAPSRAQYAADGGSGSAAAWPAEQTGAGGGLGADNGGILADSGGGGGGASAFAGGGFLSRGVGALGGGHHPLTADADDDGGGGEQAGLSLKAWAALALLVEAVAGMYLPLLLQRLRSPQWWLSLLNCFSGGIFLAAGIIHLLPHCAEAQEALGPIGPHGDYPLYLVLVVVGYCAVFYVERVLFDVHGEGHTHCQHSNVFSHSSYYEAISHRSYRPPLQPPPGAAAKGGHACGSCGGVPLPSLPHPRHDHNHNHHHGHEHGGRHGHVHGRAGGGGGGGGPELPEVHGLPCGSPVGALNAIALPAPHCAGSVTHEHHTHGLHGHGHGHHDNHGLGHSHGDSHFGHAHECGHDHRAHRHSVASSQDTDGATAYIPMSPPPAPAVCSASSLTLVAAAGAAGAGARQSCDGLDDVGGGADAAAAGDGDGDDESCHSVHTPRAVCVCVEEEVEADARRRRQGRPSLSLLSGGGDAAEGPGHGPHDSANGGHGRHGHSHSHGHGRGDGGGCHDSGDQGHSGEGRGALMALLLPPAPGSVPQPPSDHGRPGRHHHHDHGHDHHGHGNAMGPAHVPLPDGGDGTSSNGDAAHAAHAHPAPPSHRLAAHHHNHNHAHHHCVHHHHHGSSGSAGTGHGHGHGHHGDPRVGSAIVSVAHVIKPRFRFMHGVVLLAALALHTALECIALGLIDSRPQFLLLFAAIASHKAVSALALSSRFLKEGANMAQVTAYVGPFCLVAPLSILAGVYVGRVAPLARLVFSCFATGTFLYVGASEVIMEEFEGEMRADRRDISTRAARYLKFGAVLAAVGLVAASGLLPDPDHH